MRLIDAELIQYEPMLSAKGNGMYEDVMVAYKSQIDVLPTIEHKTGKWVWSEADASWCCEACGCVFEEIEWKPEYNYCPNCGSEMRGDDHEND